MSIVFKFTADNSDVVQKLGEIKEQMSCTEFSMCAPSVLGLRSQAKKGPFFAIFLNFFTLSTSFSLFYHLNMLKSRGAQTNKRKL